MVSLNGAKSGDFVPWKTLLNFQRRGRKMADAAPGASAQAETAPNSTGKAWVDEHRLW